MYDVAEFYPLIGYLQTAVLLNSAGRCGGWSWPAPARPAITASAPKMLCTKEKW
jgi:hypothetical protein